MRYSFIIPVYNRPEEIQELLESFQNVTFSEKYEIVIIEDGSTEPCDSVIDHFKDLPISYYIKANSGPGPSRNYGMKMAKGNYFIILDSDCLLPPHYLLEVNSSLTENYVDFFGGPDAAHKDFTPVQKAINYTMTSLFTTGGIRGRSEGINTFQPRSFNMGISKDAFEASGGFGKIHPGEDPDLTLRLWNLGYNSKLISRAFVYHKRRISWDKFYKQVRKFGLVRPILNTWHPKSAKATYWFPFCFILYLIFSVIALILGYILPIVFLVFYLIVIGIDSSIRNKSLYIGLLSIWATLIQFMGYGSAFIESTFHIQWAKKLPQKQFPHLFFE